MYVRLEDEVGEKLSDNFVFNKKYDSDFNTYDEKLKSSYQNLSVERFSVYEKKYFVDSMHMDQHEALEFSKEVKALYPEEFKEENLSMEQVEGINDYILQETQID